MIDAAMEEEPLALIKKALKSWNLTEAQLEEKMDQFKSEVDEAFHAALALEGPTYNATESERDLYAPSDIPVWMGSGTREMRMIDAIHDALGEALKQWPDLVLMGQDIGAYGGVFKATEGYTEKFGEDRVRNTPLCESAIVGSAIGYAMGGGKAMMEMQFSDFVSTGFNQIVNNAAKLHWRWGQGVDVVIRMPTGAGVAAGPFHSQSTEAWFTHTPGLKVVYPAYPGEAKALLLASFADPNPVMFFEHKALYRTLKEEVPEGLMSMTLGKGAVVSEGSDLTIITYGMGVHWALDAIEALELSGRVEVFNLRTLVPLDFNGVAQSVRKTGKVIVLQEDVAVGGYGEHIVARITKECWESLDGPVTLVASDPTPVPFHQDLEEGYLAKSKLHAAIEDLLSY
jgi:2-oxoisovalerate dehydrogenase E1 component